MENEKMIELLEKLGVTGEQALERLTAEIQLLWIPNLVSIVVAVGLVLFFVVCILKSTKELYSTLASESKPEKVKREGVAGAKLILSCVSGIIFPMLFAVVIERMLIAALCPNWFLLKEILKQL